MPDQPQTRQKVTAGHDAYVAGRDLTVNVTTASEAEPALPGLLPRDVPAFTGRDDELAQLAGLAGGGRVVVSAIGGTAGVGKTALAVHAAHQLLPQFPDGHLYADLRGYTEGQDPAEPGEVLQVFLRSLGVPAEEIPAVEEERSGLLRQMLAGRRVLMVLDNARTELQVRPLLPGAGGSLVLVTSRSVLPGLEADERISLDVLREDEAVAMLAQVIGTDRAAAEAQVVAEVARLCGRLPLALRIAGQLLASHPRWQVGRLVQLLADEQDRLTRLGAGDLQVRAAFEVSYAQLAEHDARLFRLLGLHPGPDFATAAAAALAGIDPEAAGPALDRLAEANLLIEDAPGRFSMHSLLRLFARAIAHDVESQADRDATEARLVGYYMNLAEVLNGCVNLPTRLAAELDQEMEQAGLSRVSMRRALALFEAERPTLLAVFNLAAHRGWDEQVWTLSEWTAESLRVLRYLDEMVTVMEAALGAARHAGDTAAESRALNNLGEAYRELGRFEEAITYYQQSLAIKRETSDRRGEDAPLNNLGEAYRELGRFEEAITCYQQVLTICQETGDRRGEGRILVNLGHAYLAMRRFEDAIGWYEQALAISRETADPRGEGRALGSLGLAYQELGRFEEAITCYQQDIAICQEETGDRQDEGLAQCNLGIAYARLGRFDEAIDCFHRSLAIFRETHDWHSEGQTLSNLGNAYKQMRQPNRAAVIWREAAEILRVGGAHQEAGHLEQLAANAQSRRRWWRRANRSRDI